MSRCGGERLRAVLAAAEQVDVAVLGERLVGADLDALDRRCPRRPARRARISMLPRSP